MKLNSPQSLEAASRVFRSYDNSWTKAREAGYRDSDGVLVIPVRETGGPARMKAAAISNGSHRGEPTS